MVRTLFGERFSGKIGQRARIQAVLTAYNFLLIRTEVGRSLEGREQGLTKICRLSWLTNTALVFVPKCQGGGGGLRYQ
jgi:hypothetical protein